MPGFSERSGGHWWRRAEDGARRGAAAQHRGAGRAGDGQGIGTSRFWESGKRAALRRVVEEGPTPAVHWVVRWRIVDLMQWLWEEFRLSVSKQTMSRELRAPWGSITSRRDRATMPRTRPRL
jgi:hypothetical protein